MPRWTVPDWMVPGPSQAGGAYPGERLGAARSGVGAVAGFGRRLAALTVDWLLAVLLTGLFGGADPLAPGSSYSTVVLGVWFLITAVTVAAFGITPGKAALGIRVASLRSTLVGVPRALLRTALVALVIPALARDGDGRGWHDRAAATLVVRTR